MTSGDKFLHWTKKQISDRWTPCWGNLARLGSTLLHATAGKPRSPNLWTIVSRTLRHLSLSNLSYTITLRVLYVICFESRAALVEHRGEYSLMTSQYFGFGREEEAEQSQGTTGSLQWRKASNSNPTGGLATGGVVSGFPCRREEDHFLIAVANTATATMTPWCDWLFTIT